VSNPPIPQRRQLEIEPAIGFSSANKASLFRRNFLSLSVESVRLVVRFPEQAPKMLRPPDVLLRILLKRIPSLTHSLTHTPGKRSE